MFTDLFAATGGAADLEIEPVDPVCGYRFADGTRLDLPFDPAAVPAALDAALGPGTGAAWQALHDRSARLWDLVGEPVLHRPLRARDLARFSARLRDLRVVAPWLTLRRLGEQLLPDPRLRMWLDRYATYSGSDPRRTPSVLSVTPYVEQRFGAWWVRGGLRRLGDALLERCRALGVAVHLDSAVAAITTAGRRVSGVRLADGRPVPADVVVSDADARVLYDRLLPGVGGAGRAVRAVLRRAPASAGGVRPPARPRRRARRRGPRTASGSRPTTTPSSTRCSAAPRPSPTRPSTCTPRPTRRWRRPAARRGSCWSTPRCTTRRAASTGTRRACGERYADRVLEVLARRGEDVRGRVRWREIRTPADLERDTARARRGDLRHRVARDAGRAAAPGEPVPGAGALPRRRVGAPGRRAADRRAVREDRGRPRRAGLSAAFAARRAR